MININKTQINFNRDPKEWGNALYTQIGQIIDVINQDIIPFINNLQTNLEKAQNKINLLNNRKI